MAKHKDSKTILVADVDCDGNGKSLCEDFDVKGYPDIRYGDALDLEEYTGGRKDDDLFKFAQNLGPICSIRNLDRCDDAKKKQIAEFDEMAKNGKLDAVIETKKKQIEDVEKVHNDFFESFEKEHAERKKKSEEEVKEIENSGLKLMKAVAAHKKLKAGQAANNKGKEL